MKKLFSALILSLALLPVQALAVVDVTDKVPAGVPKGPSVETLIKNVTNTLAFVAGALAVIAIIVGGILYITSGGDEKRIGAAKNTILYAVVGMVIAVLAYSIANFVLKGVTTGPS